MARELPAAIMQIGSRPGAPQAELTVTGGGETLDASKRVVPVGRWAHEDGAVEVATRTAEVGHRDVVGVEGAPAVGQREGGIECSEVEHDAAQQRVSDVEVALPAGHQVLFGPHAVDNDGPTSHDRCIRIAPHRTPIARCFDARRSVAHVGYRVLGAVELVDAEGHARPIGSTSQRTLLAVLLAAHGDVVGLDALVEAIWLDAAPATALTTLRTYVSRLRARLGPALVARGGGYALDIPAGALDSDRFEALVDAAQRADPADAVDLLAAALDLWHGPAYGDRADVERVRAEARRLDERCRAAREARAVALLRIGRHEEAVAAAETLVDAEPLREGGWAVLIEALAGAHRTADALRAYRRAAAALAEVGLEPTQALRDAEQIALRGTAPRRATGTPSEIARSDRFVPPLVSSSFVGRDDDVKLIAELVCNTRLVTLAGPGGVGKTRLAVEVARGAAQRTELGSCLVELASVANPVAVPDAIVTTLGLSADGRSAVDILPSVGDLDVLIVLDNAEHVIDATAAAVECILSGGASARVLATSREPLAIDGEHLWTVAPLVTADADASAAILFRERAASVGATPDDPAVMRLVQRLDGLPLAIEMAAAQLDTTTAEELADALDERLDTLRSIRRLAPARHRSLNDVLAWSEARLDDTEAGVLAALSIFAGPVVATDIEGVLEQPGVLDVVRTLTRRSLVNIDRSRTPARFYLLETIREFARQRLVSAGRADELARRHAEWFAEVTRAADVELRTTGEAAAQARLESVLAELRAARDWAFDRDLGLAADLSAHLYIYAQARFVDEPLLWAEQLLDRVTGDDPHRPVLLAAAATRHIRRGNIARARELAHEAVERAGDTPDALPALDALTDAGLFDGRVDQSRATARAMMQLARRHGDLHFQAIAGSGLALSAAYGGEPDPDVEAVLADLDQLPLSPSARGWLAYTRGELCHGHDSQQALTHYADALREARTVNNRYLEGAAIVSSCSLRARTGDPFAALDDFADAVNHWNRVANTPEQLTTLRNLAVLFQRVDAPEPLAELLGAVDHADNPTYGEEADRLQDARSWASTTLGPVRLDELSALGATRNIAAAAHAALDAIDVLRNRTGQW
jgi:predicted ATPase/DNA-binding SARP family transcriptional activator